MSKRTILVWCDLETTGLKPIKDHRILEYAVVLTDLDLRELGAITCVIPQKVATAKSLMDSYVLDMHTNNGLIAELERVERELPIPEYVDSARTAGDVIVAELERYYSGNTIFVIAGNTVGFDKEYIEHHMPSLFQKLHYRQLDVSSYKVGFPNIFGTQTSIAHRAMDDIRASIEQHRLMQKMVDYYRAFHPREIAD